MLINPEDRHSNPDLVVKAFAAKAVVYSF